MRPINQLTWIFKHRKRLNSRKIISEPSDTIIFIKNEYKMLHQNIHQSNPVTSLILSIFIPPTQLGSDKFINVISRHTEDQISTSRIPSSLRKYLISTDTSDQTHSAQSRFEIFPPKQLGQDNQRLINQKLTQLSSIKKEQCRLGLKFQGNRQKILVGNFLHLNFQGFRGVKSKEVKNNVVELPKTERTLNKSNTEDEEYIPRPQISLASFQFDFVVGKGGFGKVWKVFQKSSGKTYAMKQMQKVKIIQKRSVHSVMNEKALLEKIKHPFLVNMIHAFQNRENLFLIMDYCNRGDLRYHLGNRRKFKQDQTRFFLACIIICLQQLHSKRVIHRDLKPENLVLDDKGYLRVTDLGVSREVKPNNAEDTSGTPGYMSPQVICKMNHSYGVDFFALGVIAFQFMTGKRPYLGANRKEIREKILAKQVQLDEIPPFGWSRQAIDLINKLIQRRPQSRLGYSGIQEVKYHPFFKKMDWQKLLQRKIVAPYLPQTIEQDYGNYKECISEDTQIKDMQEYKMILRHKDTQDAFIGYDSIVQSPSSRKRFEKKKFQSLIQTTTSIRKRK